LRLSPGTHLVSSLPDVLDPFILTGLVQIPVPCCAASHHDIRLM